MHHDASSATLAAALAASLFLFVTACTVPDPDAAAERAAVNAALDSVYATFSEAYAQANITLLMDDVYAEDAYYLPPDSPILHGQDQFRGQFNFLERFARDGGPGPRLSFEIIDRDIAGDLAYDIGIYTLRAPGDADAAEAAEAAEAGGSRGKFIVIWKRVDGEWRIQADGFSAVPPMGPRN